MGTQSARYFTYSKGLLVGMVLGSLSAACVLLVLLGIGLMVSFDRGYGWVAIAGLLGFVLLRLCRAVQARGCSCQLCHGPVLMNKDCNKHRDARRYPLLGYRKSLMIDAAVKGRFNCMYCGTPYRMWR